MTDDPSGNASSVNAPENKPADQVVPLGPACLMVFVIILLFVSVAMVIGAWMLMGNQSKFAVRALESQLVPWVEQSPLDPIDKEEILATLDTVIEDLRQEKYSDRQLARLNSRVTESPILQWGVIQQVESRIAASGLSEQEKSASALELDRMLRCASEGKLSLQQMEFIVQPVATKERMSGKLTVLEKTSDANLQDFLRRAKSITDNYKIPSEEFPKSVAQVFRGLIDDAKVTD